jgi:hypothetical protein
VARAGQTSRRAQSHLCDRVTAPGLTSTSPHWPDAKYGAQYETLFDALEAGENSSSTLNTFRISPFGERKKKPRAVPKDGGQVMLYEGGKEAIPSIVSRLISVPQVRFVCKVSVFTWLHCCRGCFFPQTVE